MKNPTGLAPRFLLFAVAILGLAVLQACCEFPGTGSTTPTEPYAVQFHYTQPNLIPIEQAKALWPILTKHHVTGKLFLNGMPILPPPVIKADGVTMAQQTQDPPEHPSGNWKTQLVALLEAKNKKALKDALDEYAASNL